MLQELQKIPPVTVPFREARACIPRFVKPLPVEEIPLDEALGHILARTLKSPVSIPPSANSAMDGFALSALGGDADGFRLVSFSERPAHSADPVATRVLTGHPVPPWALWVAPEEHCRIVRDRLFPGLASAEGLHIRPMGEDLRTGDALCPSGSRLDPVALMRFASAGFERVPVTRRPRVAVLTTGNELVRAPMVASPPCLRYECDSVLVAGMLRESGADPLVLPHLPDDAEVIGETLSRLEGVDLLITCGGAANSEFDHVRPALKALGAEFCFERVQMKPARPTGFGILRGIPFFTLPGNPVAVFVSVQVLVHIALRILTGQDLERIPKRFAISAARIPSDEKRHRFQRVILEWTPEKLLAHSYKESGSGLIRSLIDCNGLVDIPPGQSVEPGSLVEIVWMRL